MSWDGRGIGGVGRGGPNIPKPHWRIRLAQWLSWNTPYLIIGVCVVALVVVVIVAGLSTQVQRREAFMEECLQDDRKHYECTAMWRGGY